MTRVVMCQSMASIPTVAPHGGNAAVITQLTADAETIAADKTRLEGEQAAGSPAKP